MEWGVTGIAKTIWQLSWLALPALILLFIVNHKYRKSRIKRFGDPRLLYTTMSDELWRNSDHAERARSESPEHRMRLIKKGFQNRETIKALLVTAASIFMLMALGRPQWGTRQELLHQSGIDLVLCVDTSESMKAQDIAPDRIEKAASMIASLLSELDGHRVGLVSFATTTRVHSPLTLDYRVIRSIMDYSLNMGPGTDIEAAIEACLKVLQGSEVRSKAIVVISDGEDHGGNIDKAIRNANKAGVKIYTLGLGTLEGAPIPEGDGNDGGYKRYKGELVWSKLEEETLIRIAESTGGRYYRSTPAEMEIISLANEIKNLEKTEFSQTVTTHREDQFGIFLLIAAFFLSIDAVLNRMGLIRWEENDGVV
ncbi:MAG: VWA domain-containing protein [bacterium]